jgi:hypothetical protein
VRDCINDQSSDVCIYTLYINVFIYRYISHKDAKLRFKWRLHSVSSACQKVMFDELFESIAETPPKHRNMFRQTLYYARLYEHPSMQYPSPHVRS